MCWNIKNATTIKSVPPHRYLAEFDFRYNNRSGLGIEDAERTEKAIMGAGGKRLFYQEPRPASHA
jgi:hypothetical protein